MGEILHCAVCGGTFDGAEIEFAAETDAGLVHDRCFEGPVEPPRTAAELVEEAEEEEARRDHGDVPLPPFEGPSIIVHPSMAAKARRATTPDPATGRFPCTEHSAAGPRPSVPPCPECGEEPSINGGRGLLCRGRSMLP
jgi:hypothetical protein